MSILFISTQETIYAQSQKLLLALQKHHIPIYFACMENSQNASFASAYALNFIELSKNSFMQYLTLRKVIKQHKITHIHVFDEKAIKLANWLKKSFTFVKILGEWHERVKFINTQTIDRTNPYLLAFEKAKIEVLFCSSPEFYTFLVRQMNGSRIGLLPYVPLMEDYEPSLLKKPSPEEVFTFYAETSFEEENGTNYVLEAFQKLLDENPNRNIRLVLCVDEKEKTQMALEQMEALMIECNCIICDIENRKNFFPLVDSVICSSCAGEGDYKLVFTAWHKKKVLIASDLAVHTKFVLADSTACALLYPRDDSQALVKCMNKILNDEALRNDIIEQGSEKVKGDILDQLAKGYMKKLKIGTSTDSFINGAVL